MKRRMLIALAMAYLFACWGLKAQNFGEVAAAMGVEGSFGVGTHGGGVSFCDFNRDGWDDLTFTSGAGKPVYFFRNNGGNSFTQLFLVNNTYETKDATWVDYDHDGDRDLFVTAYDGPDKLYRNEGNLNMVDVTQTVLGSMPNVISYGAVWGDYDRDGWLDLYVCHYELPNSTGVGNDLYRNNGNGTFTKVSSASGVDNGELLTFDACFVDLDENGWQDLYVINDKFNMPNTLYLNSSGAFQPALGSGANIILDAMNAGGGDYDDDGDFDLYVTNTQPGNELLANDGSANFTNLGPSTGTEVFRNCWGATFFDFDLDQDQDLYVSVNGNVAFNTASAFLVNLAESGFSFFTEPLQFSGGLGGVDYGFNYGHATGDLNNDGMLDIAVSRANQDSFIVWQNNEAVSGNWLKVDLFGTSSNWEGIGARVEVDLGGKTLSRYRHGGQGYLSQHSHQLHFGLGAATQIDELRVYWPSGIIDTYTNISNLNQVFFSTEGEAALPAELISFSAAAGEEGVWLDWKSASEHNLAYYEPEFSPDGRGFTSLTEIAARGSLTEARTYRNLDRSNAPFPRYYRLRMVDWDGSFKLSSVIRVEGYPATGDFTLATPSPNPATSYVDVSFSLPQADLALIRILAADGRLLREEALFAQSGQNIIRLPLTDIRTASQLFLSVSYQGETQTMPIIINHDR